MTRYKESYCYSCGADAQTIEWNRGDIPMADAICCEVDAPDDWEEEDLAWCDGGGALVTDSDQWGL